ncbi:Mov34/MPN/PAD-1 family protein [Vibrio rotiferianus]|uniref:Mov34/MPN/PAD-1 family protein n=1 Tax=Vibrio rotiferianus TaxID=190895 RepID=UPI00406A717E
MSELISNKDGDILVRIGEDVIKVLEAHRQVTFDQPESGGILIGEYRGPHLNVIKATTPNKGDIQSRFRFFRRSKKHQLIASKIWKESNETQTFIGDWHTHAEDHPSPSLIDITDWKKKLSNRKMIVVIQGRVSRWYGIWNGETLMEGHAEGSSDRVPINAHSGGLSF